MSQPTSAANAASPGAARVSPATSGTTATPGTAARAFLAWRTTASAMVVCWLPLIFIGPRVLRTVEGFQDLAYALLVTLAYALGVVVVVPLFVFTLGRWLDRRTAPRGLGRSVFTFAIYGLGFGIVFALLLGMGGVKPLGIATLMVVPLLSAILSRLFVELRGPAWYAVFWVVYVLAMFSALIVLAAVAVGHVAGH